MFLIVVKKVYLSHIKLPFQFFFLQKFLEDNSKTASPMIVSTCKIHETNSPKNYISLL